MHRDSVVHNDAAAFMVVKNAANDVNMSSTHGDEVVRHDKGKSFEFVAAKQQSYC